MTIQLEWQLVLDKEESNSFKSLKKKMKTKIIKTLFLKLKYTSTTGLVAQVISDSSSDRGVLLPQ